MKYERKICSNFTIQFTNIKEYKVDRKWIEKWLQKQ